MARALLLDADPDLAAGLEPDAAERARHAIVVEIEVLEPGPWTPDRSPPPVGSLGVMLLEGMMLRELVVADARSIELLSRGDILRPWQEDATSFSDASWQCLTRVRLATLGPRAAAGICRWPQIASNVIDRALHRSRSLAVYAAIEGMVGLDRRLVLLFWHLAEHWGERKREAIEIPLPLTHEQIGLLVGARRPSVTAALNQLATDGTLERTEGGWILRGDPPAPGPARDM